MSTSYSNFFESNSFGINVKNPKVAPKTQPEQQQNVEQAASFFKPVEKLVNTVKDVFNGNVAEELNRYRVMNFNTELILHEADVKVNGQKPTFDMMF